MSDKIVRIVEDSDHDILICNCGLEMSLPKDTALCIKLARAHIRLSHNRTWAIAWRDDSILLPATL